MVLSLGITMSEFIKLTTPGGTYWQDEDRTISVSVDDIASYQSNPDVEELAKTIIKLKSGKKLNVKETVSEIENLINK